MPSIETPGLKDQAYATFLGTLSSFMCMFPEALDPTIDRQAPSATRLHWWHIIDSPTQDIAERAQWVTTEGDPEVGRLQKLPKQFNLSAIIAIDRAIMDGEMMRSGNTARPAVSYKLGTALMGGYSRRHAILGLEHEDDQDYRLAMGIGEGPLIANAGVTWRGGNSYYAGRGYTPLESGIRLDRIVPKHEIPPNIPSL